MVQGAWRVARGAWCTVHAVQGSGKTATQAAPALVEAGGVHMYMPHVTCACTCHTPRAHAPMHVPHAQVTPGLFEGLRLLVQHPYVLGIFAVTALFEIIATIMDYQMKVRVGRPAGQRSRLVPLLCSTTTPPCDASARRGAP